MRILTVLSVLSDDSYDRLWAFRNEHAATIGAQCFWLDYYDHR